MAEEVRVLVPSKDYEYEYSISCMHRRSVAARAEYCHCQSPKTQQAPFRLGKEEIRVLLAASTSHIQLASWPQSFPGASPTVTLGSVRSADLSSAVAKNRELRCNEEDLCADSAAPWTVKGSKQRLSQWFQNG